MAKTKIIIGNKEKHILEIEASKFEGVKATVDGQTIFESHAISESAKSIKLKVGKHEQHFIEIKVDYNESPAIEIKVDGITRPAEFIEGEKYVDKKI